MTTARLVFAIALALLESARGAGNRPRFHRRFLFGRLQRFHRRQVQFFCRPLRRRR